MNETIPVLSRPAKETALALVIALALLVAPGCAPLCAASACSSGGGRQGQCHDMANMASQGGEQYVATSKTCGATDFPAVLIKADEQSLLWQIVRDDSAPVLIAHSSELALDSLGASPGRWGVRRVPLESKVSVLLNTILRI
jgi:hypothetical protein